MSHWFSSSSSSSSSSSLDSTSTSTGTSSSSSSSYWCLPQMEINQAGISVAILCGIVGAMLVFLLMYAADYFMKVSDMTQGLIVAVVGLVIAIVVCQWFYPVTHELFGGETSTAHLIYDGCAILAAVLAFFGMKWLMRGGYPEGKMIGRDDDERERIGDEINKLDNEIQSDIAREEQLKRESATL